MAVEISVKYENVDQAELALLRLRELGIHPQSYRVRSVNLLGSEENESPFATAGAATDGASNNIPVNAFINAVPTSSLTIYERPSDEVNVNILIDSNDAQRAQSALISTHGYQIRQY